MAGDWVFESARAEAEWPLPLLIFLRRAGSRATLHASADGQFVLRVPDPMNNLPEFKGAYTLNGSDFKISISQYPAAGEMQGTAKIDADTLTITFLPGNSPETITFRKSNSGSNKGISQSQSEIDARNALESRIHSQMKPDAPIRLVSFRKTNGIQREINGMKAYDMEFSAEIEFGEKCWWSDFGDSNGQTQFYVFRFPLNDADERAVRSMQAWASRARVVEKGERRTIQGTFRFIQTENGLRLHESTPDLAH